MKVDITNVFGKEFQATFVEPRGISQGRSKKKLRPVIKHDGRVFVARHEGRKGRFFGSSVQEATHNLEVGAQ